MATTRSTRSNKALPDRVKRASISRGTRISRRLAATQGPARQYLSGWSADALQILGALDIQGQECTPGDLRRVHPLFSESTFLISRDSYALLIPALRLASAFLYEPHASVFWYSLVFGPQTPIPHFVNDDKGGKLKSSEQPWSRFSAVAVGAEEWQRLESFWEQMQQALAIRFRDLSHSGSNGQTVEMDWGRPYPPGQLLRGGHEALITLSMGFLNFLRTLSGPTQTESLPDRLRQNHILAITLLHELCHAIHIVQTKADVEPFFEDHRQAELGFAWEQSVLNGVTLPVLKDASTENARWGLQFNRWPEEWSKENSLMVNRLVKKSTDDPVLRVSRRRWTTRYLVTMVYIQSLVTTRKWEQIAKRGPQRLKMVKTYGLRVGVTGPEAWERAQSSGASSHFASESYALWSEDSREQYSLVRRQNPDSASEEEDKAEKNVDDPMETDDSLSSLDSADFMDIDKTEFFTAKNKRRRSRSDDGDNASQTGRDPKRPRLSD